ncbi:hypothetical protein Sjap_024334 [Stephania japonica]|uniref:Translation initiation factor eIF2B subunit delta n=1 Tax=Stephania japonica TaxID=461633 RepID=A0AAP0EI00_9MAGN
MEARRSSRMVIDPKVRQVGFFTPSALPDRTASAPTDPSSSPPVSDISPANSLSPVMIPPPRHASDNFTFNLTRTVPVPVPVPGPGSPLRHVSSGENMPLGSYNPSESFLGTSPLGQSSASKVVVDGEFSDDVASPAGWFRRGSTGKVASSLPSGGFDMAAAKKGSFAVAGSVTAVSVVKMPPEKSEGLTASQNDRPPSSKPLKEKTSKADRRALQESQRAAKAAARAEGNKGAPLASAKAAKSVKHVSQKKDGIQGSPSVAASEKKGIDYFPEKERKKDAPHPRMQFDDKERVEKAKRRAVVKKTEVRNRVELFRHLPQYEHGTQLPYLECKFFQLEAVHPSVYKVGLRYLAGDICGGNARCIAMLEAFKDAIRDYSTPPEKTLNRDLTSKIGSFVSFLIECRPLSISMGNAIRFLKNCITNSPLSLSDSEAKSGLLSGIDRFINEKVTSADQAIVKHAVSKIRDGDVLLTYSSSAVVEAILLYAHDHGKQFRVVIVDSRPKLEGQALMRRLVEKGLSCTYTHINAVSYIMHEVTKVLMGAASVLSNGTVYSRVGTACVAMVAHQFRVPVLICCEAYKFDERVLLDSICSNELGDPDAISKVPGRLDVNHLNDWADNENMQLLNLLYDATPSDYVSMIVTDYGMIPPTSVPVIVRQYGQHLW